jgi:hypothetical protein
MIRFVEIDSHRTLDHIPQTSSKQIFYDVYLDGKCIGQTIGVSNTLLVVNLFGQGHHSFRKEVLEKNLDSNITLEELIALGKNVG